jgi:hypothetical protein
MIYVIDALLILAMLFFLFLPITDRMTVRMRLSVFGVLATIFAVSAIRPHVPAQNVQLSRASPTSSD